MALDITQEMLLNPLDELRKRNPKYMEIFDKEESHKNKVSILRAYDVNNQEEEILIQALLDKIESPHISSTEEAKVRQEMADMESKGMVIDSPDEEAKWELKLQEARDKDRARAAVEIERRKADFARIPSKDTKPETSPDTMSDIKGLGEVSINKLREAGVTTPKEFNALSHEQLAKIVGPLVAAKFKI